MEMPYNPNGSLYAIEGITSPDGRVFGKMCHSERFVDGLYRNITGNKNRKSLFPVSTTLNNKMKTRTCNADARFSLWTYSLKSISIGRSLTGSILAFFSGWSIRSSSSVRILPHLFSKSSMIHFKICSISLLTERPL